MASEDLSQIKSNPVLLKEKLIWLGNQLYQNELTLNSLVTIKRTISDLGKKNEKEKDNKKKSSAPEKFEDLFNNQSWKDMTTSELKESYKRVKSEIEKE